MAYKLSELQSWYRGAMGRRVDELRELRPRLVARNGRARDHARKIGMSLRGSGGTFGFPEISDAAALLETARDTDVLRRVEGLIGLLRDFATASDGPAAAAGEDDASFPEWLAEAAGLDSGALGDGGGVQGEAWDRISEAVDLDHAGLAARVAEYLGVEVATEPGAFSSARRLVPEALARRENVVPVDEGATVIVVVASDPTKLRVESELQKLTGRSVVYQVAPPATVDSLMARVFPRDEVAPPVAAPEAPPIAPEAPPASAPDAQPATAPEPEPATAAPPAAKDAQPATAPEPEPATDPETPPATAPEPEPATATAVRVLVVDDEPEQRLFTRAILEKKGYEVVEAEDGVHALEVFESSGPVGLVVADLNMPRMDGLELIWELRATAAGASLPIIVVTGEKDRVLESQLIEEGADDYLRKPIEPRLFLARVESTVRRHALA